MNNYIVHIPTLKGEPDYAYHKDKDCDGRHWLIVCNGLIEYTLLQH